MTSFAPILELESVMRGFPKPWFVSGGWAIDLFVGRVTREHEDVEVGAFHPHQGAVRAQLAGWELHRIREDRWEPWQPGDSIELPEFQAQARKPGHALAVFDIFFNPLEGDDWVSRRHEGLNVAGGEVFATTPRGGSAPPGIPYLRPEIQLLYKAKHHRPKDDADFDVAVGALSSSARRWLKRALRRYHPGDRWIDRL